MIIKVFLKKQIPQNVNVKQEKWKDDLLKEGRQ